MSESQGNLCSTGSDESPRWFLDAINHPSESYACESSGARIHYRGWRCANPLAPAILFVHGFRAHSHWWDFIAPSFVPAHRVFALDFAGMGDSGPRAKYDLALFSRDIVEVIHAADLAPAILIGHSFGGARVLRTCIDYPNQVRRAIILDSGIYSPGDSPAVSQKVGRLTPYPDKSAILARYRLMPEQPAESYLRRHVAEYSIRQVEGGWRWKFDPTLASIRAETDGIAALMRLKVPLDYVCGELSRVVTPARVQKIACALMSPRHRGPIILPGAHHHVMLDQPLQLIKTLQMLLSQPDSIVGGSTQSYPQG